MKPEVGKHFYLWDDLYLVLDIEHDEVYCHDYDINARYHLTIGELNLAGYRMLTDEEEFQLELEQ